MEPPLVSVVTVALNPGATLDRTCTSVSAQTWPHLEWVVIDGASTDGTPERLRNLPRPPDILVSEPDRGIADAMNKGIARCTGDAVLFMNAGDAFAEPESLTRLVAGWDRSRHAWAFGDAWMHAEDGRPLYLRQAQDTTFARLLGRHCGIQHAAAIVTRTLFDQLGPFDGAFRLAFDYEFWVRCYAHQRLPQHVPVPVSRFYLGGASADRARRDDEWRRARARHGLLNPWPVERWLDVVSRMKRVTAPLLRRCRWAYRAKEALGW